MRFLSAVVAQCAQALDRAWSYAAEAAARQARPQDDIRGSAAYKRNVVRVFTERGLREAAKELSA